MNKRNIQQSIVDKLAAGFDVANIPLLARNMPEGNAQYELGLANPIAYVFYAGSTADPSASTNVIAQPRRLKFNVEIHSKLMYSVTGSYGLDAASDIVEQLLIGYKPLNCQRLSLTEDSIAQTEAGVWLHVMQFECQTMLIQVDESDPVIIPSYQETIYSE